MTLVMGVGQAGCNIVGEIAEVRNAEDFLDLFLVNSTVRDMVHLDSVPRSQWLGINEKEGLIELGGEGQIEKEVTGGMGKDPRRCFTSLTDVFDEVVETLEGLDLDGGKLEEERFALLAFAGGGGTGAGAAPVLARAIQEITDDSCRVLGVMVLPVKRRGEDLESGGLRETWNTWFSFQRSMEVFDGLVVVDNDRLSHLGDIERGFPRFNKYVARCLTDMVLGNLTELELPEAGEELVVQQSDVQDLITAMSLGPPGDRKPGVASIGRGVQMLRNPLGYLLPVLPPGQPDLVSLSMLAQERMTLDGDGGAICEKAYVLVRAPSKVLSRAGTGQDVSEVLSLLAQATGRDEVIYGTALTGRPLASVTLGMTYDPETLPRLKTLEGDAMQYEWEVADHPSD